MKSSLLEPELRFIPVSDAMYEHFIDRISRKHPERYEIIVTESDKRIIRDCHGDEPCDIAYRYINPIPVWGTGYSIREDYFKKYFPVCEIK